MIKIQVIYNGVESIHQFRNDYRGNQKAKKLMEELHDQVVNHPWYYMLKKIENLEAKLKGYTLRQGTKARTNAEIDLRYYQEMRDELLEQYPDIKKPFLKVNITHD